MSLPVQPEHIPPETQELILEFWRLLYGEPREGFFTIATLDHTAPKDEGWREKAFQWPDDAEKAAGYALSENAKGRSVYQSVLLRKAERRILENIETVSWLFSDLDGANLERVTSCPPSVLIESSPGRRQGYWPLTEPIPAARAASLLRRLITAAGGDEGAKDLTRVLRVPGTVNHKYEGKPAVSIVSFEPGRVYDADELDRLLPPQEKSLERVSIPQGEIDRLLRGPIPTGKRHDAAKTLATHFAGLGTPERVVREMLRAWGQTACVPPGDDENIQEVINWAFEQERAKTTPPVAPGAILRGGAGVQIPSGDPSIPFVTSPWQVGPGRQLYSGDRPVLRETLEPRAVLEEDGMPVGVEMEIGLVGGRPTSAVIPAEAVTERDAAEMLRQTTGLTWTPADAKVVQRRVADAMMREPALRRIPVITQPGWHGDQLILPGKDLRLRPMARNAWLASYGECAKTDESEAREAWSKILVSTLCHPRLLVVLGAAAGSLYVTKLERMGFIVHAKGESRQGKTLAVETAMALYGNPVRLVRSWNTTRIAIAERLSMARVLPVALDEEGASGLKDEMLEAAVFGIASGKGRGRAGREGGLRPEQDWQSVVLSTGEGRLTVVSGRTGLRARVVEVQAPITPTAEDIDTIQALAVKHFGWPLAWCHPDAEKVKADFDAALASFVGRVDHPVMKTVARHLAVCAAGFLELCRWVGVGTSEEDVFLAVGGVLDEQNAAQSAEGISAADRLYEAVREDRMANPDAYTEEGQYGRRRGIFKHPDWLCVLPSVVKEVAKGIGLGDAEAALRQLRDQKRLVPDKDGRLQKNIKVKGQQSRMLVFKVPEEEEG